MRPKMPWIAMVLVVSPLPIACTTAESRRLQHVVLVELADQGDISAMQADSDRMLPSIPTVRSYACGAPVDIGRPNVAKDYDLGIVVTFDSIADYKSYLVHPVHQELVTRWKPRWKRSYIVDFAPPAFER